MFVKIVCVNYNVINVTLPAVYYKINAIFFFKLLNDKKFNRHFNSLYHVFKRQLTDHFETANRYILTLILCRLLVAKGALSWYGKLTLESAHAWNMIILCYLIVWGINLISMVHLSFYAIPLLIYDVMNDITIIP